MPNAPLYHFTADYSKYKDVIDFLDELKAKDVNKSGFICQAIREKKEREERAKLTQQNGGFSTPTEQLVAGAMEQQDEELNEKLEEQRRAERAKRAEMLKEQREREQQRLEQKRLEEEREWINEKINQFFHGDIVQIAEDLDVTSTDIIKIKLLADTQPKAAYQEALKLVADIAQRRRKAYVEASMEVADYFRERASNSSNSTTDSITDTIDTNT